MRSELILRGLRFQERRNGDRDGTLGLDGERQCMHGPSFPLLVRRGRLIGVSLGIRSRWLFADSGLEIHTLAPDASVPQDPDLLANLVVTPSHVRGFIVPCMLLLCLVQPGILSRSDQPVHESPLRDRRTVDAGAGSDGYFTLFKDGVIHEVIQASRYKVDQLDTMSGLLATWKGICDGYSAAHFFASLRSGTSVKVTRIVAL